MKIRGTKGAEIAIFYGRVNKKQAIKLQGIFKACVRQLPLSINDCKQTIDSTTDPLSFLECVRDDKNTICPRPCFCSGICEIFLQQSPLCKICNEDDQFRASFESIRIQNKAVFNVKLNEIEYGRYLHASTKYRIEKKVPVEHYFI